MIRLGLALSGIALTLTLISGVAYVVEGVTLMRTPAIVDSHEADGGHAASADSSPCRAVHSELSLGDATHTRIERPVE